MLSSRDKKPGAHSMLRFGAVALSLVVSGCLQPLYGPSGVAAKMSAVEVAPIGESSTVAADVFTHEFRNELAFLLGGEPDGAAKSFRLVTSFMRSLTTPVIDSGLGRVQTDANSVTVEWKLLPIKGGAEIAKGRAVASVTFDRGQQRFATVRAERDASRRAAKVLADQVRSQVAAYFSRNT